MSHSYSKDQIARILNKASQVQARMDRMGDSEGLNQTELVELAAEVGLSEQAIIEAINDLTSAEQYDKGFDWLSASSQLQFDQMLIGEFTEADKERIISEIRSSTGGIGKVHSPKASQIEWEQRRNEIGYKHITISSEENGRIRLLYNYNWGGLKLALSAVVPVLSMALFVIIGKGAGLNEFKGLFALGGLVAGTVGSRIYLKTNFDEQKQKFNDLKSKLNSLFSTNTKVQGTENSLITEESSENQYSDLSNPLDQLDLDNSKSESSSLSPKMRNKA